MPREIDITQWKRKDLYYFFKEYEMPFFNMTAHLCVTPFWEYCKEAGLSIFLANLHCAIKAANKIEEFKYRLREEKVVCHDIIHGGSTVLFDDKTFGFCYFDYDPKLDFFCKNASQKLTKFKAKKVFAPEYTKDDLIHFSVIPWINFTSFQHARRWGNKDAIPKIVFGKIYEERGEKKMSVSVEVHHALVDGYQVGLFFEYLETLFLCK